VRYWRTRIRCCACFIKDSFHTDIHLREVNLGVSRWLKFIIILDTLELFFV
jgi:hypothetical protein